MKKSILVFAAMFAIAYNGTAQNRFHLGVKAGANLSKVYDAQGEVFNADSKIGFAVGGFMSIPLGAVLGIQPEVLFSQKGFKSTGKILGNSYTLTRTTNYLDVPIFLAINASKYVSVLAGPQFSYLLSRKDEFGNNLTSVEQVQAFKNDDIRKNMLGVAGGLDINVHPIVIGARVGWDLMKNNGDGTKTTPRYKNVWAQVSVGFRIF